MGLGLHFFYNTFEQEVTVEEIILDKSWRRGQLIEDLR